MKLSQWAKQKGITYTAAWKMYRDGNIPNKTEQLPTGTIIIYDETKKEEKIVIYSRVSSYDQKGQLEEQAKRVSDYLESIGMKPRETIFEIASGMNGNRHKLKKILEDSSITHIAVEHRDRLTRFGFEYIEAVLSSCGRKIIVCDQKEIEDDIVRDLHEIIVSMCARLYGKRSARNKAMKAIEAIKNAQDV